MAKSPTTDEKPAKEGSENPSAWDRYQLASAAGRPQCSDYLRELLTEFHELSGDRGYRDDPAVIAGLGRFDGKPLAILGQEMGKEARERQRRNFGMMHPEGYRKAMRIMNLAARLKMPVVCLVDTKGAFPGPGAEERGQAEAIARNIRDMYKLRVPVIVVIIGSGASGGALGIGLGDRVLMLENAWYNVISPEGCASILWKDRAMAPTAAERLRLTAQDNLKLGVIDEIIPEPNGGAHTDPQATFATVRESLARHLARLAALSPDELLLQRAEKYRKMGVFREL